MPDGGWSSGTWGEAGWGMSVYYRDASETAIGSDAVSSAQVFISAVEDTAAGTDSVANI